MKLNVATLVTVTLCGGLLAGGALVSCGGGSSSGRGSGGASGSTGGTSGGTGGTSGGTGGTSGGTGGASGGGINCAMPRTAVANLTDFSDWSAVSGKWGTSGPVSGSVFGYKGAMSTEMHTVTNGAFSLSGTVKPGTNDGYMGGGLAFDVCASAAAFTGISFDVSGNTGGCALELQLQTYSTKSTSNGGGCASGCSSGTKRNLSTSGTVTVSFSELMGAAPVPPGFSAAELVGIQWQLTIPPGVDGGAQTDCAVALTFDNIKFY